MGKYFFSPLFFVKFFPVRFDFFPRSHYLPMGLRGWVDCYVSERSWYTTDLFCKEKSFHRECLKCFSDDEEAEKILVKTIFRRSRAFMELGYQLRALNDISFCLRNQVNATGNANNVLFNYWEVGIICKNTGSPSSRWERGSCCVIAVTAKIFFLCLF